LREDVFPTVRKSRAEIARLLRIPPRLLYGVLNEKKPMTADLALRIAKLVGGSPEMWLGMQRAYDLEIAERALRKTLKGIPTLEAAE